MYTLRGSALESSEPIKRLRALKGIEWQQLQLELRFCKTEEGFESPPPLYPTMRGIMNNIMEGRQIIIELAGEQSIDGQTKPGGSFHILEFEDGEWTGGGYADKDSLTERVMEFFTED